MTSPERWRLRRSAALHGLAVVVFGMLALSGAGAATPGLYGLAVPLIITGIAGAAGAAVLAVTVWRQQRGDTGTGAREGASSAPGGADATQRTTRLAMAATAVVVLLAGMTLAPQGVDRGFVIAVAALLAALLALFALLAGDRLRTTASPSSARDPR